MGLDDFQGDGVAAGFLHFTQQLFTRAIQYGHPVARSDPQDVQSVMRFSFGQGQWLPLALRGWKIKTVHGGKGAE